MKRPKIALGLASLLLATTTLMGGCIFLPENISGDNAASPDESDSPSPRASDDDSPSPRESGDSSDSPAPREESPQTRNGKVAFILINETNRPMERFFASPSNTDDWEEDIFGEQVLAPNKRIRITINDGRKDCIYDFKASFGPSPDGSVGRGEMVQTKINICTLEEWGFSPN
jgi:hypothetical protein